LSDDSQDSDFEFNVINIRFYITKGYQCRINLSSAVVVKRKNSIKKKHESDAYSKMQHDSL